MSAEAFVLMMGRDSLVLSLGIVGTLALRRLLRGSGGATLLPWCWALPPALLLAVHLPRWPGLAPLALAPGLHIEWLQRFAAPPAQAASGELLWPALAALWLAGLLGLGAAQWQRHRRFVQGLRRNGEQWRSPAGSNPGLLGLWQPRPVLPEDFERRFETDEQALVLAHEDAHRRRHDNLIQLAALLLSLLHWFNPLAWWALSRLQRDQELACDAAVLSRPGNDWRPYAEALLKAQGRHPAVPLVAHWRSNHPLIERIDMLKQSRAVPSRLARLSARGLLLACITTGVGTAMALKAETPAGGKGASAAKSEARLNPKDYCQMMLPAPPMTPELAKLKGEFLLRATYVVETSGKLSRIEVSGEAALQPTVRNAIERYQCKPNKVETQFEQEFSFKLD